MAGRPAATLRRPDSDETVPSSAARGRRRPAAALALPPSSATGAKATERSSLRALLSAACFPRSPPPQLRVERKALQKFAPGPGGRLSPALQARKVLCRGGGGSPDLSGRRSPLSALSAAPGQRDAPPGGGGRRGSSAALQNAGPGATGASSGELVSNGKTRSAVRTGAVLTVSARLPESEHLHSRLAAIATLSATLSPYPARAQHLSATSQPLKIAHDVTPRPSHWLASLSRGRARPSPWRPHPRRFFSGPAEAHGMR